MKTKQTLLLLIFSCFAVLRTFAQSDFAPVGATWYHSFYNAVYKSTVSKDTIIDGQACKIIDEHTYINPAIYDDYKSSQQLFVYSNADTIFIYNTLRSQFTPLFVFNVLAGDTVSIPYMKPDGCSMSPDFLSVLNFYFVVDSVKNVAYGTEVLKTVFSHSIKNRSFPLFKWRGTSGNVYAQKIGGVSSGFLPYCSDCPTIPECSLVGDLRCYSDGTTSIKLVSDACDNGYKVRLGIAEHQTPTALGIAPNPARDIVSVTEEDMNAERELSLYNSLGMRVGTQQFKAGNPITLSVSNLVPGLYFLRIENKSSHIFSTGKLVKE